jgi:TonB-dependent starch-binding outer membrane protein SusC
MRQLLIMALLCPLLTMCQPLSLRGKILDESSEPLAGATVTLARNHIRALTGSSGEFSISHLQLNDTLLITAVGYKPDTVIYDKALTLHPQITIQLQKRVTALDDVLIIGYGKTTRRLSTQSVGRISAEEISHQPVFNPLSALQGRIPGLSVSPTSGIPGSAIRLQVRGRSSLAQGSDPLLIIDGVPFAPNNNLVNQYYSAAGGFPDASTGLSPLASISPSDIASIEVLKDADATAIYGSRGANGVILITTKKGAAGKTSLTASLSQGYGRLTRTLPMQGTGAYLSMRKEAFQNDGVVPTTTTAPDLTIWDTARYTDLRELFLSGTAPSTNASLSLAGGGSGTQFLLSSSWSREGAPLPGDQRASRAALHLNLSHAVGSRLTLLTSATYSSSNSQLLLSDLSSYVNLSPNYPSFYLADGSLNWQEGGVPLSNPFAYLLQRYQSRTDNLLSSLEVSYRLTTGLLAKLSGGYNSFTTLETTGIPKAASNPYTSQSPTGSSQSGSNRFSSWILEPQLQLRHPLGKTTLTAVVGATLQENETATTSVTASGITSDGLLYAFNAAADLTADNSHQLYRYEAAFGRLTVNMQNRYLLNLSGRRDGSSRFGPGRQWATFGALGAGWLLHTYPWWEKALPAVSFFKLRGSYGTTGNDQIGNYQYLDSWTGSTRPYNGFPSLLPTRLDNPAYAWEMSRKWDLAIEAGLLKDRFFLTLDYFVHQSSNQLIRYNLPLQTGFSSVLQNFPATVQNKGVEVSLTSRNLAGGKWEWTTTVNLTIPRNRLLSFPGIETSSYANTFVVGQSTNLKRGYHFLGVNPQTGVYEFLDTNSDGQVNTRDYVTLSSGDPAFYGGIGNTLRYGAFSLDVFFELKRAEGRSFEAFLPVPGTSANLPEAYQGWWQKPGDVARHQRLTTTSSTEAYKAVSRYTLSDAVYTDASYLRCKTLYLAYTVPAAILRRAHLSQGRFFLQAQNLFVLTRYRGADPEVQNTNLLQPLRTLAAGFSLTF